MTTSSTRHRMVADSPDVAQNPTPRQSLPQHVHMTHFTRYPLVDEDVTFRLPVELRRELALAETQR